MSKYWIVDNNKLNTQTQEILNEYLLYLKLLNRSKRTITKCRKYLETVLLELSEPVSEITSDDILNYIHNINANLMASTLHGYISILSNFFNFCLTEEYIDNIIVKNRWKPKRPIPEPKYLDKTDLAKVKLVAEKLPLRDRAIFEFMLSSGSRVGEVIKLNVSDVDLENRTAMVNGKGSKIRQVHFTENCKQLLEEYSLNTNNQ